MSDTRMTITLPSLGEDVTEATVSRWLVTVGDDVDADEPLLEVATDKVDTEIPSTHAGTVVQILAAEDEVVEVGASLVTIAVTAPTDQGERAAPEPQPAVTPAIPQALGRGATLPVNPTGEVEAAGPAAEVASGSPQRLPRIRQIIAARMLDSLRTSAQLTSVVEVDVTGIGRLRTATKAQFLERTGAKLSFLPFFAKATIEALGEHPLLSATVNADCTEITYSDGVHLALRSTAREG
jgi:2-oxoglutarate dehydrogenase E2 component (dihydrolipoamide succinyltransferase)